MKDWAQKAGSQGNPQRSPDPPILVVDSEPPCPGSAAGTSNAPGGLIPHAKRRNRPPRPASAAPSLSVPRDAQSPGLQGIPRPASANVFKAAPQSSPLVIPGTAPKSAGDRRPEAQEARAALRPKRRLYGPQATHDKFLTAAPLPGGGGSRRNSRASARPGARAHRRSTLMSAMGHLTPKPKDPVLEEIRLLLQRPPKSFAILVQSVAAVSRALPPQAAEPADSDDAEERESQEETERRIITKAFRKLQRASGRAGGGASLTHPLPDPGEHCNLVRCMEKVHEAMSELCHGAAVDGDMAAKLAAVDFAQDAHLNRFVELIALQRAKAEQLRLEKEKVQQLLFRTFAADSPDPATVPAPQFYRFTEHFLNGDQCPQMLKEVTRVAVPRAASPAASPRDAPPGTATSPRRRAPPVDAPATAARPAATPGLEGLVLAFGPFCALLSALEAMEDPIAQRLDRQVQQKWRLMGGGPEKTGQLSAVILQSNAERLGLDRAALERYVRARGITTLDYGMFHAVAVRAPALGYAAGAKPNKLLGPLSGLAVEPGEASARTVDAASAPPTPKASAADAQAAAVEPLAGGQSPFSSPRGSPRPDPDACATDDMAERLGRIVHKSERTLSSIRGNSHAAECTPYLVASRTFLRPLEGAKPFLRRNTQFYVRDRREPKKPPEDEEIVEIQRQWMMTHSARRVATRPSPYSQASLRTSAASLGKSASS